MLYYDGRFHPIAGLAPGQTLDVVLPSGATPGGAALNRQQAEDFFKALNPVSGESLIRSLQHRLIRGVLTTVEARYQQHPEAVHLVGWTRSAMVAVRVSPAAIPGQEVALINWEIPEAI
jgi:hypothetical protein